MRDYQELHRRFQTFVGLSEKNETIESGYDRLNARGLEQVKHLDFKKYAARMNNFQMARRFKSRNDLFQRWKSALTTDPNARVIPSVRTPRLPEIRWYHFKHTFKYLISQILMALAAIWVYVFQQARFSESILIPLLIAVAGVLLYKLPKTIGIIRSLMFHLPVDGSLKQIGMALCVSLCRTGLIETSIRRIKVNTVDLGNGNFNLAISGATFYESSLFADCLAEVLAPIDSPRYLIVREGKVFGLPRDDYHAVPIKLAAKKKYAKIFYQAWCEYVCPSELIYTRNDLGRKILVKAKMKAFSSVFKREISRLDKWQ